MEQVTFLDRIAGSHDPSYIFATLIFAFVGVFISLLIHSTNRERESPNSPAKFSLKYLVTDNWKRILLSILLVLVTIRFCKEITGVQLNEFVALLIGVSFDKLSEFLQNKKILIGKKESNASTT